MAPMLDSTMAYSVGDMVLKEAFPGLFGIARTNDAFVADSRGNSWRSYSVERELC
jgi:hypothetical protein